MPLIETKDIRRDDLVQMACKKAIKGGDTLSQQEVNTLLALTADEVYAHLSAWAADCHPHHTA